ncbi:MAG: POTRA domain-containing protein, partial [Phocaeicola sp.]
MKKCFHLCLISFSILLCTSCSVSKFIPDNGYLLDQVLIESDLKSIKTSDLENYIRQNPNSKWFNLVKVPMGIYILSGSDDPKGINRFLRKIGDAPVIYDKELAEKTRMEIEKAVRNTGYIRASVVLDEEIKKNRIKLSYKIKTDKPYTIGKFRYDINDANLESHLLGDSAKSIIRVGMPLDVSLLNNERQRITQLLQNSGYYKFHKDYIVFQADTVRNSYNADVTLRILPYQADKSNNGQIHEQYRIGDINFIVGREISGVDNERLKDYDCLELEGATIFYAEDRYLRPKTLLNFNRIKKGGLYAERDVQSSYVSLGRLGALKFSNISFQERETDSLKWLDTYITIAKGRNQLVDFEIDGTNSGGDLGAAASISYQHRNFFRGSENFTIRLRGAYEAVTGLEGDYASKSYLEYGVETSLTFPEFKFPFLSTAFKRKVRATSEVNLAYNAQYRPEFLRTSASAAWRYRWVNKRSQHRFSLIDVNYLYIPSASMSSAFRDYLNELFLLNSL